MDWTSANPADIGNTGVNDDPLTWTDDLGTTMCDSPLRLYCFEVATPVSAPTVTSVSPSSGPANTTTLVTLTGTGFGAGTAVTHGPDGTGFTCGSVSVVSETTLTCTTANTVSSGVHRFIVTTPGGTTSASSATFTFDRVAR